MSNHQVSDQKSPVFNQWSRVLPDGIEHGCVIQPMHGYGEMCVGYIEARFDRNGRRLEDLLGACIGHWQKLGLVPLDAYMRVPTLDVDPTYWHGEFLDGKEPPRPGRYIVTVEWYPNHFDLEDCYYEKGEWIGAEPVVGWRHFPAPYRKQEAIIYDR